jgi:hypothetical protein
VSNEVKLQGRFWLIRYGGVSAIVQDSKGLRYLVELLRSPGEMVESARLVGAPIEPEWLAPADRERIRKSVTNRIRHAIRQIDRSHPGLGRHLCDSIVTGKMCSYRPVAVVDWELRTGLER